MNAATGEARIRVVVADDHEVVRTGYAALLDSQPDFSVVGTARDGAEAVRVCRDVRPDVVLMDVRMPRMDGIEATRLLLGPDRGAAVDARSGGMSDLVPQVALPTGVGPDAAPKAAPKATPRTVPETVSKTVSHAVHKTVSNVAPEAVAGAASNMPSVMSPNAESGGAPNTASAAAADSGSGGASNTASAVTADAESGGASNLMSRMMPGTGSDAGSGVVAEVAAAETGTDAREVRPRVLVLTTFDLDEYVYDALRAGASGFLLKDVTAERLFDAVRVVAAGEALLAPSVTRRLISEFAQLRPKKDASSKAPAAALSALTPRETQVLCLVAEGLSNPEIAARLIVTEETVKTHVSRVLSKLGLRDRTQAVVAAYESGLVVPQARPPSRNG